MLCRHVSHLEAYSDHQLLTAGGNFVHQPGQGVVQLLQWRFTDFTLHVESKLWETL